jgi:beta-glucosidase
VRCALCRVSAAVPGFAPGARAKGVRTVSLGAGEKKSVRFTLSKDELTYWSSSKKAWVEEPEAFDVWVGADSKATLHASFHVTP